MSSKSKRDRDSKAESDSSEEESSSSSSEELSSSDESSEEDDDESSSSSSSSSDSDSSSKKKSDKDAKRRRKAKSDSDSSDSDDDRKAAFGSAKDRSGKGKWQYKTKDGWHDYASADSRLIDESFKEDLDSFITTKLTFNKEGTKYSFNFKEMIQANRTTGNTRDIRRKLFGGHSRRTKGGKDKDKEKMKKKKKKYESEFDFTTVVKKMKKKKKLKKEKKKARKERGEEKKKKEKKKTWTPKKKTKKSDSDSDDGKGKGERKGKKSASQLAFIKKQAHYGAQSRRGIKGSPDYGPTIDADKHGKYCFDKLFENETRNCGEWGVFYHSYSLAALIYEVQAAVAAVLFRFRSQFASLPRLVMAPFKKLDSADALMTKIKACKGDHNMEFRRAAICASTSLVSTDPEATPKDVFLHGYSLGLSFLPLLEILIKACGVPSAKVKSLAKEVVAMGGKYGLDTSHFGGKACASGRPGHLLQIFVKRDSIDQYVYSALPFGHIDTTRHPIAEHLEKNVIIQGQVRICAHPEAFLRASVVRMFVYSADPTYHSNREKFQSALTDKLWSVLGSRSARLAAAKGIFGGKLPEWYEPTDQRGKAEEENDYK